MNRSTIRALAAVTFVLWAALLATGLAIIGTAHAGTGRVFAPCANDEVPEAPARPCVWDAKHDGNVVTKWRHDWSPRGDRG